MPTISSGRCTVLHRASCRWPTIRCWMRTPFVPTSRLSKPSLQPRKRGPGSVPCLTPTRTLLIEKNRERTESQRYAPSTHVNVTDPFLFRTRHWIVTYTKCRCS